MKGLSVIIALGLLVLAQQLAWRLQQAGALPKHETLRQPKLPAAVAAPLHAVYGPNRWLPVTRVVTKPCNPNATFEL